MIGFNGGLIGKARDTSASQSLPGVWTLGEQVVARRRGLWPADQYFSNVSLLLLGDGTNGSTVFTDIGPNAFNVNAFGSSRVSTAVFKHGTGSINFPTNTSYLTVPNNQAFSFAGGNFTVECWVYMATQTFGNKGLITNWNAGSGVGPWQVGIASLSTSPVFYWNYTGSFESRLITGTAFTQNAWGHLAIVRNGALITMYQNGVSTASANVGANSIWTGGTGELVIAADQGKAPERNYIGYIDDIRITKGVARYTSTFTPPGPL